MRLTCVCILMIWISAVDSISGTTEPSIPFEYSVIDNKSFGHREIGDVDGNGLADIVAVNDEEGDACIVWYEFPQWKKHTICEVFRQKDFKAYRSCDLEAADIDGDGDLDVVGRIGLAGDDVKGVNCWFENPLPNSDPAITQWKRHNIGESVYVKDIEIADFNGDKKPDVAVRTHAQVIYWLRGKGDSWIELSINVPPKEGMEAADIDRDGDPDIVLGGCWIETPSNPVKGSFRRHDIDAKWFNQNTKDWRDNCCKVAVADMNGDGNLDVLFSQSEKPGYPVSWYEAPQDPQSGLWKEHVIGRIDYCHNLKVADFDIDGDLDVLAAEMPRYEAPFPVVVFLNGGDSRTWETQTLADTGNYSVQIGDIGNDGDVDVVGLRRWDQTPFELWENKSSDRKLTLDVWTYIQVDAKRGKWGDTADPDWLRYFGLAMRDLTGDGLKDIVSGRYFYRNPGGEMTAAWPRVDFGRNVDAILSFDVDGDPYGDVIAQALPSIYWLEAKNRQGDLWVATVVGSVSPTDHVTSQGFVSAQIVTGGKPEFLIAAGDGVYCFEIPADPMQRPWKKTRITTGTSSEGIGVGDVDGDGNIDITAASEKQDYFAWWKNPGDGSGDWPMYKIGRTPHDGDRFVIAEINGDGKPDVVVTEERYPGPDPDANLWWYEQPPDPTKPWFKHFVATEYSLNNLGVADMDRDGDMDIVTCEHKGPEGRFRLQIWENDGQGNLSEHCIDRGKESHLGTQLADLDGDGDLDIVSIAWDRWQFLHVWRNDAIHVEK